LYAFMSQAGCFVLQLLPSALAKTYAAVLRIALFAGRTLFFTLIAV